MSSSVISLPVRSAAAERWKLAAGLFIALLAPLPVIVAIHAGLYDGFIDNALTAWGMWGTFFLYAALRPGYQELFRTTCLGVALRMAYDWRIGEKPYPGYLVLGLGTFLGLASLVALIVRSCEAASEKRTQSRRTLAIVGMLSYIGVGLSFYISFAKLALPSKLDYFIFNFDNSLGFQLSFFLGRMAQAFPPLSWTLAMVYNSLGFWFAVICAMHANSRTGYRISVLKLLAANATIGFLLYFLFPAMGPRYAFASYPLLPGEVHAAPILASGVPNAMPSLHFAGALLICWLARPWKWLYWATIGFAALTAMATLGLGEHYVADLIVAVPYALAIFAFSVKLPERRTAMAAGTVGVAVWLWFLRLGHFPPVLSWAMVAVTLSGGFGLMRRLAARVWIPC